MKRTDWLLCLAKNCDWFKFKIQKIQKNLNRALSSSVRLSSNIDHRGEPIRMRELLGLLYNDCHMGKIIVLRCFLVCQIFVWHFLNNSTFHLFLNNSIIFGQKGRFFAELVM